MQSLVNMTARLVIINGKPLIPRKPVDADVEKLKATFPEVAALIRQGDLRVVNQKEAKQLAIDFEAMEVAELKDYAEKKGISLGRLKKKTDILERIRAAESEALAKKE